MINDSEKSKLTETIRQNNLDSFTRIIDVLSGDKSNIRIIIQEVKVNMGKTKLTLNGEVNFNVIHAEDVESRA